MVHYKIVYFDAARRAETARLILTHAGVDFEDVRIPKAEWPGEHKASEYALLSHAICFKVFVASRANDTRGFLADYCVKDHC